MNSLLRALRLRALARAATASLPLCLALALALGLPAQAQNLCATQASPVNPVAAAPSGVGGTGAPARGRLGGQARNDTGGIGGTGAVAGRPGLGGTGISEGGTGIVGVITGFASICVNGVEVHFDAGTPVSDNGQPGSARQLAVGQVVAVRAAGAGAEVSARNIAVIHAAVGPLEAPDAATGAFRILGQTARALNPDDLSGLKAGDWVRVSGHRLAQGEIAASRIEPIAAQPQAQLNGSVGSIDADSLMVNGTRVRFDAQPLPAGLAPGREVLVSGAWDGSTLQAERVQLDPTRDGLGRVERVVFEGYVQALGERELSLGLVGPLTLSPDMQIVGGSAAELAVNRRVQVSGRVGADQRVTVERLELRNGADGSDRSGRSGSQRGSDSSGGKGSSSGSGSSGDSGSSGRSGASGGSGSSGSSGSSGGSGSSGSGSGGGSGK